MFISFHFTGNVDTSSSKETLLEIKFILEDKHDTYIRCQMVIDKNNQFIGLKKFSHKDLGKINNEIETWIPGSSLSTGKETAVFQAILAKQEIKDIITDQVWNMNVSAVIPRFVGNEKIDLDNGIFRIYTSFGTKFGTKTTKYRFQMDTIVDANQRYFLEEVTIDPLDINYKNDIDKVSRKTFQYEVYRTEILIKKIIIQIENSTRLKFMFAQTV